MASIDMGTLYAYSTGSNYGRYSCVFYYDSVTRNGTTVTVNNARAVMTRYSSGYTTNRIAGCCYLGDSQNYISWNKTLSSKGSQSPATITYDLGSPSYNTTGTSLAIAVYLASTGNSGDWGNFQGNSPLVLATSLPCPGAYTSVSQSFNSKTETSIKMNWSATDVCDHLWYSINNGSSWVDAGSINASSGTYQITGLSANTNYNIKTMVRRKDSQLQSSYGSYTAVQTYNWPYITSAPNFIIGDNNTISIYNPLGRSCSVYLNLADGSQKGGDSTTGTSISGYSNSTWQGWLYNSIPNSKSGNYTVRLVCSAVSRDTTVNGGTYSCNAAKNEPTFDENNVSYFDSNSQTVAITGNNQKIIQLHSNLKVNFTAASAKNGASISQYKATVNSVDKTRSSAGEVNFGTINSSSNLTLTATVTDSRGYTKTITKTITMLEWSLPTGVISLIRKNNFEDESYLTVQSSCSSIERHNRTTMKYQYKKSSDSQYSSLINLPENQRVTINCSKSYVWDFRIIITDLFGSTTYNIQLPKGIPIFYVDTHNLAVGVNCFPNGSGLFVDNNSLSTIISNAIAQARLAEHPIGDIIMNVSNINPSTYIGGTWISWGQGRVPVGVNPNDSNFNTVEKTGGSAALQKHTHTVGAHSHGLNNHTHSFSGTTGGGGNHNHYMGGNTSCLASGSSYARPRGFTSYITETTYDTSYSGDHTHSFSGTTGGNSGSTANSSAFNSGESGTGNAGNLQPYITCYYWKRTA